MSEFRGKNKTVGDVRIARSRTLSKVYLEILSWDLPLNNSADPDDLGEDAGSASWIAPNDKEDA